jgi:hypothetical protein
MQDLNAQREKLLINAADCEIIANLACDERKREVFRNLARRLRQTADDLGAEIAALEARDAA